MPRDRRDWPSSYRSIPFNLLPADLQALAAKHLNQGALDQRADLATLNVSLRKDLEAKGMVFNEVEKGAFRDKLRQAGFYKEWRDRYGDANWKLLERTTGTTL